MDAIIDISTVVWVFVALVGVLVALRLAFWIYKRFRARKLRLIKGLDPPPIRGGEPPNLGDIAAARLRQVPVGTYTDTDSPERIRCDKCGKLVYFDEIQAVGTAKLARSQHTFLRAYFEPRCGNWHLTKQRSRW